MFEDIIPPHILKIIPYKPGKPITEVTRELGLTEVIKLASNENPLGPSPSAVRVIREKVRDLHYYPEDSGYFLRHKLGDKLGVDPDLIHLGNGSCEIIVNLGRAFLSPGDQILTSHTSFVMYYLCGAYTGNEVIRAPMKDWAYDLDALAARITPRTRLIFIANPNNPTGSYFDRATWEAFLAKVPPKVLVVLDEAYCEYVEVEDYPDGLRYLADFPNLVVLRTFSKIYGLAGIRAGYGVADREIIDVLYRVKLPFNANALGQEAAAAALDDDEFVGRSQAVNREGLAYLQEFFRQHDVEFVPSVANFVMVHLTVDAGRFFERMQRRGVLIRPLKGFGSANAVRVTVGSMTENRKFTRVFSEVMADMQAGKA
ncbi:MAG: histidinol-phosphate transaminase [Acidobacteria bacterium]|nr:histidinol-phosphate transaminase [Acidobacteriota bacterium]